MTVEESPLLVFYRSVSRGQVRKTTELHLRNQAEQVLIAHKMPANGKSFACNRRVVTDDVFGVSHGPFPMAKQIMSTTTVDHAAHFLRRCWGS